MRRTRARGYREELYDKFGFPSGDLLILHTLEVLPAFCGWNLGLLAAQQVIAYYARAVVMLRVQPLQFVDGVEQRG